MGQHGTDDSQYADIFLLYFLIMPHFLEWKKTEKWKKNFFYQNIDQLINLHMKKGFQSTKNENMNIRKSKKFSDTIYNK